MLSILRRLWTLARPKAGLFVVFLPLVGYGYGLWERGSTRSFAQALPDLALLALAWGLGHAGAMWLNGLLDRDEGGLLLGKAVEPPTGTLGAAYLALVASPFVAALTLGPFVALCALLCAGLAVAYSHPRLAQKGHPIGGPLINGAGYGTLSPLAGVLAADPVLTWRTALTLAVGACFILGAYFAAQAWQADEDRARGYRTLVATHGPRAALAAARLAFRAGIGAFLLFTALGAYPRGMLLGAPLFVWADRWLGRWARAEGGGTPAHATGLMWRLLAATLVVLAAAYAHQGWQLATGGPPGGLGTAWVPAASTPPKAP